MSIEETSFLIIITRLISLFMTNSGTNKMKARFSIAVRINMVKNVVTYFHCNKEQCNIILGRVGGNPSQKLCAAADLP